MTRPLIVRTVSVTATDVACQTPPDLSRVHAHMHPRNRAPGGAAAPVERRTFTPSTRTATRGPFEGAIRRVVPWTWAIVPEMSLVTGAGTAATTALAT